MRGDNLVLGAMCGQDAGYTGIAGMPSGAQGAHRKKTPVF